MLSHPKHWEALRSLGRIVVQQNRTYSQLQRELVQVMIGFLRVSTSTVEGENGSVLGFPASD